MVPSSDNCNLRDHNYYTTTNTSNNTASSTTSNVDSTTTQSIPPVSSAADNSVTGSSSEDVEKYPREPAGPAPKPSARMDVFERTLILMVVSAARERLMIADSDNRVTEKLARTVAEILNEPRYAGLISRAPTTGTIRGILDAFFKRRTPLPNHTGGRKKDQEKRLQILSLMQDEGKKYTAKEMARLVGCSRKVVFEVKKQM